MSNKKLNQTDINTLGQMIKFEEGGCLDGMGCRAGDGSLSHMSRLERLGLVEFYNWGMVEDGDMDGYHSDQEYRLFKITEKGRAILDAGKGDK